MCENNEGVEQKKNQINVDLKSICFIWKISFQPKRHK